MPTLAIDNGSCQRNQLSNKATDSDQWIPPSPVHCDMISARLQLHLDCTWFTATSSVEFENIHKQADKTNNRQILICTQYLYENICHIWSNLHYLANRCQNMQIISPKIMRQHSTIWIFVLRVKHTQCATIYLAAWGSRSALWEHFSYEPSDMHFACQICLKTSKSLHFHIMLFQETISPV